MMGSYVRVGNSQAALKAFFLETDSLSQVNVVTQFVYLGARSHVNYWYT